MGAAIIEATEAPTALSTRADLCVAELRADALPLFGDVADDLFAAGAGTALATGAALVARADAALAGLAILTGFFTAALPFAGTVFFTGFVAGFLAACFAAGFAGFLAKGFAARRAGDFLAAAIFLYLLFGVELVSARGTLPDP